MARFTQGGGSGDGSALNYVQVESNQVTITTAPQDVVSLEITTTGKPVQVSITGEGANASAGAWVKLALFRDGNIIGQTIQIESSAVSENVPYALNFIDEVSAGTHTYTAKIVGKSSGNWTFGEVSGPVMNAVELTGFKGDRGLRGLTGDQGPQGEQGPAGTGGGDLVIPTSIKDENDADFITITRTNTGTARIDAPQDDLSLRSAADITLFAGTDGPGHVYIGWGDAEYTPDSPNRVATIGDIQNVSAGKIPVIASFLTYQEGRSALPVINENFGWDNNGLWFGPTSATSMSDASYPVFTNFTIPQNTPVHVEFDMVVDAFCSDIGMAIYVDGTTPNWTWGTDSSRIAAQFDCPSLQLNGLTLQGMTDGQDLSIPGPGTYRFIFEYNPTAQSDQVTFTYSLAGNVLAQTSISEVLPAGDYRIGFASDNDGPDEEVASNPRSYIKNLLIKTNPQTQNEVIYESTLMPGSTADFVFTNNVMSMANNDESMILKTVDGVGVQNGEIKLDPNNSIARIKINDESNQYYDGSWGSWSLATWTSNGSDSYLVLANAEDIFNFINSSVFNYASNIMISVNGGNRATYNGWSGGPSEFTLFLGGVNNDNYDVVNNIQFFYNVTSQLLFDYDEGEAILESQDLNLNIRTTGSRDISLFAGDDIDITAGDDIRFYANNRNGSVQWRMNSEGGFEFPGSGYIENPIASSGDGQGLDTLKIVPDGTTVGNGSHQYIVIDPTSPNHIHVRAGGPQDNSTSELILGAEMTHVKVSDQDRNVYISTRAPQVSMAHANINQEPSEYLITTDVVSAGTGWRVEVDGVSYTINDVQIDTPVAGQTTIYAPGAPFGTYAVYNVFAPDYTHQWNFDSDGKIYGPGEDGALELGGELLTDNMNLSIKSNQQSVVLNGQLGEFLGSSDAVNNQIATIGDLTEAVGVGGNGEVTRWSPNFTATGLAFTGTDSTHPTYNSHYVKNGRMVSFWIQIDLDTVTNFGTGQYITALPYAPLTGTMNHFQAWANVDPTVNPDIAGHVVLQADHLVNTTALDLHYLKQAGGANSPLMEAMFKQGAPATLTTSSKIYINGTYITAE